MGSTGSPGEFKNKMTEREIKSLQYYANLEGSEIGELCSSLCHIAGKADYYIGKEFKDAVNREIME